MAVRVRSQGLTAADVDDAMTSRRYLTSLAAFDRIVGEP